MNISDYHFRTHWTVQASPEEVFELISRPENYPHWFHGLWIRVSPLKAGDERGIGRTDFYELRGFLPYTLKWTLQCVEAERPYRFTSLAAGDLKGKGVWTFQDSPSGTEVQFDWQVSLEKPVLKQLSFLLRPIFLWNHDFVMRRWEISLNAELERRQKAKI